jgi:hypothetical protein
MLSQNFQCRGAETQRRTEGFIVRFVEYRFMALISGFLLKNSLRLCVAAFILASISCGSKPTDPRTVIPADSLVYLETSDLGKLLDPITSNPKFQELAKTKPDTSALNGIRLSVAVTGLQASEEPVSEEHVVGHFRPRFVAVAETNAWNYQALSFAENKLGEFVNDIYDGEIELVTTDKHGGKYFTWTARDGRKAFALVRGSLILFANDESAIETCINVMNGGAESIAKNAKVSALAADSLASGYVSPDGVGQIANIAGVSLAIGAGEEGEVRRFIARVLPEIVRNSVTEMTWTSTRQQQGRIEDSYVLELAPDTARVLGESIVPGGDPDPDLSRFIPKEFVSTTRYNLKDAQIGWRGALLTARTKTDQVSGGLLVALSSSLFEPYGIEDAEMFLRSVESTLQTVRFDAEGEEVAVTARIKDLAKLKNAVAKELDFSKAPEKFENAEIWRSGDGELAAGIVENRVVIGDAKSVEKLLSARNTGQNLATVSANTRIAPSSAAIVTFGTESDPEAKLISILSDRRSETEPLVQTYTTETRFNQNGIDRRTVSDFGLIGMIIGRLDPDN